MSEEKRLASCFICTSYNVCKCKTAVLTLFIMYKEYWEDNGEWDDMFFLLASKCRHYHFVGEEAFGKVGYRIG